MSCNKGEKGPKSRTPIRLAVRYERTSLEEWIAGLALLAEAHLQRARTGVPTNPLAFQRPDPLNGTDETGVAPPISP